MLETTNLRRSYRLSDDDDPDDFAGDNDKDLDDLDAGEEGGTEAGEEEEAEEDEEETY